MCSGSALCIGEFHRYFNIAEVERRAILDALRQTNGDKLKTALLLGIGKTTLYRKLKEYGLRPYMAKEMKAKEAHKNVGECQE
jgi:DNA-binding NtrC family response regulator